MLLNRGMDTENVVHLHNVLDREKEYVLRSENFGETIVMHISKY